MRGTEVLQLRLQVVAGVARKTVPALQTTVAQGRPVKVIAAVIILVPQTDLLELEVEDQGVRAAINPAETRK